jgi:lipoprotein-anchoring transpeptidase ErfK/SrfK
MFWGPTPCRSHLLLCCLVPAPSSSQIDAKLCESSGDVALRASVSVVVIAFALTGSVGGAAAQYYPPPPPAYPAPAYSSAPMPAPDEDWQPVAPRYGRTIYVYRDTNGAPIDPRYVDEDGSGGAPMGGPFVPARADGQYDGLPPQPMPPNFGGAPFLRPPAAVSAAPEDDVTGTVRAPTAAAPAAGPAPTATVAGLPPDEQPETGPRKELPPQFRRQLVDYVTKEPAGTIIIDTPNTYLYLVLGDGKAMRYGIGVGREGFTWAGSERISRMKEWPDWFPPKEMIDRQPYLPRFMAGGDTNPLGARAMYLGNTLYRIHGTNQPSTIGTFVSSGCIRLTNEDVADLYSRVSVGTRVVVLPGAGVQPSASAQSTITR